MGYWIAGAGGLMVFGLALYYMGKLSLRLVWAAMFLGTGTWRKSCVGASFTRCSGRIYRILRVPEGRSYSFRLSGHTNQGAVQVQLWQNGGLLCLLTPDAPTWTLPLEKGKRCRLTVRFQNASGDYQLEWG